MARKMTIAEYVERTGRNSIAVNFSTAAHWARSYVARGASEDDVREILRDYDARSIRRVVRAYRRQIRLEES